MLMKATVSFSVRVRLAILPVLFGANLIVAATSSDTNSSPAESNQSDVSTNAPTAATETPVSVFVIPPNEKEGKDPFFPRSRRVFVEKSVSVPTNPVPVLAELRINGTSGSEERPLVIINNVTFGVGDSGEVISGGRRIRVQCLEINLSAGTATIQSSGQQRILRFQKSDK